MQTVIGSGHKNHIREEEGKFEYFVDHMNMKKTMRKKKMKVKKDLNFFFKKSK
jgi:hypothetical protein